jgi:glycogen(starch) synthase
MKIMMLGWELPPHNSGGLGVACYYLAKALAKQGANIDFVLPYSAHHPDTDFMKIHAVSKRLPQQYGSLGAYDASRGAGHGSDILSVQSEYEAFAADFAKQNRPDVIHAHDWLTLKAGVVAKRACGAPLIVHVHASEFERAGGGNGNPIVHEIEQEGLMQADRILAVSNLTRTIIIERYGIPADKVEVAHNGFDAKSMSDYVYDMSTYVYLEHLKREGYTVISTVGRLTLMKGLVQFLHAAARASEKYDRLAFLIAGDGEQKNQLVGLAAELGISDKVFFAGFVRGKQWRDAYSVSDVFVMNSSSEPFGLTALEAAHHNNALIISKQSGVGEVLRSVLRADYWDIDRLADEMVGLATSDTLLQSLKSDVKNEYARISWDDVATKCLGAYETVQQTAREKVFA